MEFLPKQFLRTSVKTGVISLTGAIAITATTIAFDSYGSQSSEGIVVPIPSRSPNVTSFGSPPSSLSATQPPLPPPTLPGLGSAAQFSAAPQEALLGSTRRNWYKEVNVIRQLPDGSNVETVVQVPTTVNEHSPSQLPYGISRPQAYNQRVTNPSFQPDFSNPAAFNSQDSRQTSNAHNRHSPQFDPRQDSLLAKYAQAGDTATKAEIEKELVELLNSQFDHGIDKANADLAKLELRLNNAKENIAKRIGKKNAIVEARKNRLLGVRDELAWDFVDPGSDGGILGNQSTTHRNASALPHVYQSTAFGMTPAVLPPYSYPTLGSNGNLTVSPARNGSSQLDLNNVRSDNLNTIDSKIGRGNGPANPGEQLLPPPVIPSHEDLSPQKRTSPSDGRTFTTLWDEPPVSNFAEYHIGSDGRESVHLVYSSTPNAMANIQSAIKDGIAKNNTLLTGFETMDKSSHQEKLDAVSPDLKEFTKEFGSILNRLLELHIAPSDTRTESLKSLGSRLRNADQIASTIRSRLEMINKESIAAAAIKTDGEKDDKPADEVCGRVLELMAFVPQNGDYSKFGVHLAKDGSIDFALPVAGK